MSEIDQQFVEYVVKSLVGKPDAVQVNRRIDEKGVLLELTVDPEDLGRVIGKRGATAQSIRTLLRALGTKNDARYNLKIIDNSPEGKTNAQKDDASSATDQSQSDTASLSDDQNDTPQAQSVSATDSDQDDDNASEEETASSDRLRKTRAELADLDDLDV